MAPVAISLIQLRAVRWSGSSNCAPNRPYASFRSLKPSSPLPRRRNRRTRSQPARRRQQSAPYLHLHMNAGAQHGLNFVVVATFRNLLKTELLTRSSSGRAQGSRLHFTDYPLERWWQFRGMPRPETPDDRTFLPIRSSSFQQIEARATPRNQAQERQPVPGLQARHNHKTVHLGKAVI